MLQNLNPHAEGHGGHQEAPYNTHLLQPCVVVLGALAFFRRKHQGHVCLNVLHCEWLHILSSTSVAASDESICIHTRDSLRSGRDDDMR